MALIWTHQQRQSQACRLEVMVHQKMEHGRMVVPIANDKKNMTPNQVSVRRQVDTMNEEVVGPVLLHELPIRLRCAAIATKAVIVREIVATGPVRIDDENAGIPPPDGDRTERITDGVHLRAIQMDSKSSARLPAREMAVIVRSIIPRRILHLVVTAILRIGLIVNDAAEMVRPRRRFIPGVHL